MIDVTHAVSDADAASSVAGASVKVEGITKWFRQGKNEPPLKVLDAVTCEFAPAESVAIIGPSGCGKTTLLRICAGLETKDRGRILVGGKPVEGVPDDVGFVFQDPALLAWETVAKNVDLGLTPNRNLTNEQRHALVDEQLKIVGLTKFSKAYPYQLSGGMQQRVGLARALVGKPRLLLLDEPLGALDALTRVRLQEELSVMLSAAKTTSILVTHDVEEAIYLANRIVVMATGPGRIRKILDVPGATPRNRVEFLNEPVALELREEILSEITSH